MRVPLILSIVLLTIGVMACDRQEDTTVPGDPDGVEVDFLDPSEVTQPMRSATQMVRAVVRPRVPEAPERSGKLSQLADTTWRAGDFTFVFEPGGHLIVRGGHFDEVSEAGVPGRVVNRSGVLTFDIMGRTTYGTWDGAALTIANATAHRLDPELAMGDTLLQ